MGKSETLVCALVFGVEGPSSGSGIRVRIAGFGLRVWSLTWGHSPGLGLFDAYGSPVVRRYRVPLGVWLSIAVWSLLM